MKIAIDARMYGLEHAGIGRYVMNLIDQLQTQDRKNEYFVLLRQNYFQTLKFKNKKFKKVLADFSHYSWQEQVFLPLLLLKLKPDLTHFPHFNAPFFWWGKQVMTIHDLIKHQSRGLQTTTRTPLFYWGKYLVYRVLFWLVTQRAAKIIVPSQWVKKQLGLKKVVVIYEAA